MNRGERNVALGILAGLLLMVLPALAHGATYYVDPSSGDDGNPGISRDAAWRNIPGTFRTDNSGFLDAAGWVKIKAGDTISVKGGAAFENRLIIDSNWYEKGRSDARIRIMADPSWGSGPVVFDVGGQTLGQWDSAVYVFDVDHVELDGSAPGGILIKNSSTRGFIACGKSESEMMHGLTVRNVKLFNNAGYNVILQRQDSFLLENVEVDGNKQAYTGGFYIGDQGFGCTNGRLRNCLSYNNGANVGAQAGGTDGRIGFWLTNSTSITYEGCIAHDNEGRGFDAGTVGSPISMVTDSIVYMNCLAYNNSAGFGSNLDDVPQGGSFWYVNCVAHHNGSGWMIYAGAVTTVYNSVSAYNGNGFYVDSLVPDGYETFSRPTVAAIKNSIIFGSQSNAIYAYDAHLLQLYTDYNLYDQGGGADALIRWYDAPGGENEAKVYGYGAADNLRTWKADHGLDGNSHDSGEGKHANFVNAAADNYHLDANSDAAGAGTNLSGNWPSGFPVADKSGIARQVDGAWDVGAYRPGNEASQSVSDR